MTTCEEMGLKEGQWVWRVDKNAPPFNEAFSNTINPGWVCLVWDDGSLTPRFSDGVRRDYGELKFIDFTQGIYNTKPSWTPKEYGGEGPPEERVVGRPIIRIQKGDYILLKDIPDEETFNAIVAECERQGFPLWSFSRRYDKAGHDHRLFVSRDADVLITSVSKNSRRRLTPADLGIGTTWDGRGLPPVGTFCSVRIRGGAAFPAKVEYVGSKRIFLTDMDDGEEMAPYIDAVQARPIRTARERVIEDALGAIHRETRCRAPDWYPPETILQHLYDAGFLRAPKENADE